jgi:hypothetical protein
MCDISQTYQGAKGRVFSRLGKGFNAGNTGRSTVNIVELRDQLNRRITTDLNPVKICGLSGRA